MADTQLRVLQAVPLESKDLPRFLTQVLPQIMDGINQHYLSFVNVTAVEPTRPTERMIRFADGENWNPGLGKGLYMFLDGTWHKFLVDP